MSKATNIWANWVYHSKTARQSTSIGNLATPHLNNIVNRMHKDGQLVPLMGKVLYNDVLSLDNIGQLAVLAEHIVRRLEQVSDQMMTQAKEEELRKIELAMRELEAQKKAIVSKPVTLNFSRP